MTPFSTYFLLFLLPFTVKFSKEYDLGLSKRPHLCLWGAFGSLDWSFLTVSKHLFPYLLHSPQMGHESFPRFGLPILGQRASNVSEVRIWAHLRRHVMPDCSVFRDL